MRPAGSRRFLVATALCLSTLGCGGGPPPPSAPSALLGQALPTFQRPTVGGDTVSPAPGRVTVVKFFAKYCEPCKRTLPAAQLLHASHHNVLVIGIAEDEYFTDVQEMVDRYGLTFPIVHDRANVLAGRFRVRELPITFVADRTGTIRWVGGPSQNERDLQRTIDSLQE